MSSQYPSRGSYDNKDISLDLQTVFRHPAGLRTARALTLSLIHAREKNPPPANASFASVSLPTFDSSPEVTSILKDILAFSENSMDLVGNNFGDFSGERVVGEGDGTRTFLTYSTVPAASTTSMRIERPHPRESFAGYTFPPASRHHTNSSSVRPVSTQLGMMSHTQLQAFQNAYGSEFGASRSLAGTESPYRVESPSGRASANLTPQPSAQRSNDRHPFSNEYNLDSDPLRLDNSMSRAPSYTNRQSRPISGHNYNSNLGHSKDVPTIKSFLPVNKTVDDARQSVTKTLQPNNSLLPPRLIASAHSIATSNFTSIAARPPSHNHNTNNENSYNSFNPITMLNKRKQTDDDGLAIVKKAKTLKGEKRIVKKKEAQKPESLNYILGIDIWLRILEFTPPSFLKKAKLINKEFRSLINQFQSIYINQRIENYGADLPGVPEGLTERQYNDLLQGKGCLSHDCTDSLASRTHWSWSIRWCHDCWKKKIEREDKVIKNRQNMPNAPARNVMIELLKCIPVGMHDSFLKPHDYVKDLDSRPRGSPRLYKYHLTDDIQEIIREYNAFMPEPLVEDPSMSAADKAAAQAKHATLVAEATEKRNNWIEERKEKNIKHMERVIKIEQALKMRRGENAIPNDKNRNGRKELFTRRATEDLPEIPLDFVQSCVPYKAAVRIFRDAGTERGWQTLKPKIMAEWNEHQRKLKNAAVENAESNIAEGNDLTDNDNSSREMTPLESTLRSGPSYNVRQSILHQVTGDYRREHGNNSGGVLQGHPSLISASSGYNSTFHRGHSSQNNFTSASSGSAGSSRYDHQNMQINRYPMGSNSSSLGVDYSSTSNSFSTLGGNNYGMNTSYSASLMGQRNAQQLVATTNSYYSGQNQQSGNTQIPIASLLSDSSSSSGGGHPSGLAGAYSNHGLPRGSQFHSFN